MSHPDEASDRPTAHTASVKEAGPNLRALTLQARDAGETVVLTDDDGEPVAAIVPLRALEDVTRARIDETARAAAELGDDEVIEHGEAMDRLGLSELGRPLRAA